MSEKRVSVRLNATGGRQVRAELEGVGDAGRKAFERLPRDVERANAKLAAFARRVAVASAAAATAAAAAAVTATNAAMDRAFEVQRQAAVANANPQMFQGMAAAAQTVGIEQEKLADILKDVNDRVGDFLTTGGGPMADFFENIAPRVGVTADQFARLSGPEALQLYVSSLERAGASQQEMTFYLEAMASDATALLPLLRNNGEEMGRLAERAADLGLVMDNKTLSSLNRARVAVVAVGQVMVGMGNKIGAALAPILEGLATTFVDLASSTGPLGKAINALSDNIGRIVAYGAGFAGLMAGQWVIGMGLAAAATLKVAGAAKILRGALLRTGIGVAIVAAGELVYWFSKLVSGAGGFGNAMGLLKDAVVEAWGQMPELLRAWLALFKSVMNSVMATSLDILQWLTEKFTNTVNYVANLFEGLFKSIGAIFGSLPEVFDRVGALAINGLVSAMETGIAGITEGVNTLLTLGGRRPDWAITAPDLSAWRTTVPEAVQIGERAAQAFTEAFSDDPLPPPTLFGGLADDYRARSEQHEADARDILRRMANTAMPAMTALRDAVAAADDEGEEALDDAGTAADRLAAALTSTEGAANAAGNAAREAGQQAADGAQQAATGWQAVTNALADYAKDAMDWGKGLGQTLVNGFQSAENAFRNFVKTGKLDFKGLVASILEDLAVLQFRNAVLGPIANALSGAFGGLGGGSAVTAAVSHAGGVVGLSGYSRQVPALAFAGAPRMHTGGIAGLRYDEVPTILQRGERVLNRREAAQYNSASGPQSMAITVNVEGARGNREIEEMVNRGVSGALEQYDRLVAPRTVARVSQDPRRSG